MIRFMKILSVVLALVVAAGLVTALVRNRNREAELTEKAAQLENVLRPLYKQISDLENKRVDLEDDFQNKINGTATVSLLYTEPVSAIYDTEYPEMKEYGYCAVVALSDDFFSGSDGYMSIEQLSQLLNDGWKWSVTFPADSESPEADVGRLLERAEAEGIGRTSLIYFPDGSYSKKYDAWLAATGFSSVMHHAEEGMPVVADGGTSDGIFYQGAVHWRSSSRRNYLSAAVSEFGSVAFEMHIRPEYADGDASYHTSMLEVIEEYRSAGSLDVMTPDEANLYHLAVEEGRDGHGEARQKMKDEINAQIAALWDEVERIRGQYAETLSD